MQSDIVGSSICKYKTYNSSIKPTKILRIIRSQVHNLKHSLNTMSEIFVPQPNHISVYLLYLLYHYSSKIIILNSYYLL